MSQHGVTVVDTLKLARELHPGKRNSLDALCDRYQVNNKHRTLHGAVLDAELLAEVYLAMTRGQDSLAIGMETAPAAPADSIKTADRATKVKLVVIPASLEEQAEHERVLAGINKEAGGKCVWLQPEDSAAA